MHENLCVNICCHFFWQDTQEWNCWVYGTFIFNFFFSFDLSEQLVGSQFPDQGSNPRPLHWKRRVLTTGQPGKSLNLTFKETAKLVSKVHVPSYIPTSNAYYFLTYSPTLIIIFFVIAILVSMMWYFIVVFICISLMTNDIEYLFMCLLVIPISSLVKYLLKSFAHF